MRLLWFFAIWIGSAVILASIGANVRPLATPSLKPPPGRKLIQINQWNAVILEPDGSRIMMPADEFRRDWVSEPWMIAGFGPMDAPLEPRL